MNICSVCGETTENCSRCKVTLCQECALEWEEAHLEEEIAERENVGWPGDGSGLDDLADMNANEADDYREE